MESIRFGLDSSFGALLVLKMKGIDERSSYHPSEDSGLDASEPATTTAAKATVGTPAVTKT